MIAEIDQWADPGMGTPSVSSEVEILWGVISLAQQTVGVQLKSTTVDARMSPTTTLQRGLALGRISATGLYQECITTATDGSEICRGFLFAGVNMLDATGTAAQKQGRMVWWGSLKSGQLGGLNAYIRNQVQNRIWFDDLQTTAAPAIADFGLVQSKAADYTVVAADNHKFFTAITGAVNFTLPTLAVGLEFTFFNAVDANMTVTSAAGDDMITANDLAADSVAFSTTGDKIGGCVRVIADVAAAKWIVIKMCSNAMTITT